MRRFLIAAALAAALFSPTVLAPAPAAASTCRSTDTGFGSARTTCSDDYGRSTTIRSSDTGFGSTRHTVTDDYGNVGSGRTVDTGFGTSRTTWDWSPSYP